MFTDEEKAQIRLYLGYPDLYRYKDTRLESKLDSTSPEAETLVRNYLSQLATIESTLLSALTSGNLKRVDEIEYFPTSGEQKGASGQAQDAGRFYSSRISHVLGVPFYGDAWGTGGYPGDDASPFGLGAPNGVRGRGWPIKLG